MIYVLSLLSILIDEMMWVEVDIRDQKWPTVIFDLKKYNTSSKLLELEFYPKNKFRSI
jgi:hypothetical protein